MGIVVTVFMLLGLLAISPVPFLNLKSHNRKRGLFLFIGYGLLIAGLWNALWFGSRHITLFWGQAAVVSGIFMVVVAIFILKDRYVLEKAEVLSAVFWRISKALRPFYSFFCVGLLISFFLYFVTLVQLNLGYPIIN